MPLRFDGTRMTIAVSDLYVAPYFKEADRFLRKDIVVSTKSQIGYTVKLLPVYEHERDLNAGRFRHFERMPQEWPASVNLRAVSAAVLVERMDAMVDWIATNIETPWSLDLAMDDTSNGTLRFSFTDPVPGVAFKMLFA